MTGDDLAIRRPGRAWAKPDRSVARGEFLLAGAINIGHDQRGLSLTRRQAYKGQAVTVGRKSDGAGDLLDQLFLVPSQNGRFIERAGDVEVPDATFTPDVVNKVAIGRESDTAVVNISGGHDLCVAVGGYVSEPEALTTGLFYHIRHVFAFRRNGGAPGIASVREPLDIHCLCWQYQPIQNKQSV